MKIDMKFLENKKLVNIGLGVLALLLVGLGVAKQANKAKNALHPISPSAKKNTPSPGGNHGPSPDPGPDPVLVDHDTIESVNKRIDEAPESKYPVVQKLQLRRLLTKARSVEIASTIDFGTGTTDLSDSTKEGIRKIAGSGFGDFNQQDTVFLLSIGYASSDGAADMNLRLAEKRAASVARFLKEDLGLSANRIKEVAVGETDLLNSKNRGKNRVAELWKIEIDPKELMGIGN